MQEQKILQSPITYFNTDGSKKPVPPEAKQYLLLLFFNDENVEKTFEIITGRENTYNFVKEKAGEIDIRKSHILVTGVPLEDINTIYAFMKAMEKNFEDGFNIDDYLDPESLNAMDYPDQNVGRSVVPDVEIGFSENEDV